MQFFVTADELDYLKGLAFTEDRPLASWIRYLILVHAHEINLLPGDLLDLRNKIRNTYRATKKNSERSRTKKGKLSNGGNKNV